MGGLPTTTVNGFAVSPGNPHVMYVAMRDGIFKSDDAGKSWHRSGTLRNTVAIAINPKRPAEVYAVTGDGTISFSSDGGGRWDAAR